MLAFSRVDERGSYVADVLPATVLFGLGLAMTVAPLTAAVLQAADRRYAGIASGVNNAIARVAALLAIAAVGAVISAQFRSTVDRELAGSGLRGDADTAYVEEARERPLTVPEGRTGGATHAVVVHANVQAFHAGMIVAGLLMIAGGLIALVGIENPRREELEAQPAAVTAA